MGKIFVLSVTDHEEYILSRIMEIIAAEPGFDHIVSSHPCNTLVFPGLELRLKERTVHRNGELISMTHREFATLVYLANHPSWVFSAGQIYEEVWGEDGENCGTAVASVIGQIRRKLTPDMPKAGYIRTVLGSGYKFEVPQGILMLVMYTCAIFYYPEKLLKSGWAWILKYNPLYCVIDIFRCSVFGKAMNIHYFAYALIFSVVAMVIGLFCFKKKQDDFILYI